jgi:hypothetical protein
MTNGANEKYEIDLALRRYDVIFRYLAAEYAMAWTKNQFFLAVNGGLLAFCAARFPKDAQWPSLIVPATFSLIGLLFSVLWLVTLKSARYFYKRWEALCVELEPIAFSDQQLWRGLNPPRLRFGLRTPAWLFIIIWILAELGIIAAWLLK